MQIADLAKVMDISANRADTQLAKALGRSNTRWMKVEFGTDKENDFGGSITDLTS